MKAALHRRYGGPDVVQVEEVVTPIPAGDQVLVRVRAASVNRADLDWIRPWPRFIRLIRGVRAPRDPRLGCDVAGVVEAVGPEVTRFRPGDAVFADLYGYGSGAFAEYACAPERAFLAIPDGLDFEVAATLPHSAILAIQGLRAPRGREVKAGDRVLIDGASGNVGPFAVQIAKHRGAVVTGAASAAKLDLVRSLGADEVLDYEAVDYTRAGQRYDWILDTDSHHSLLAIRRALKPDGVYVTLGGSGRRILAALVVGPLATLAGRRWMGLLLWWKPFKAEDVATLAELILTGALRPMIDRRFPLDDIVEALHWVDDGHARGKVIITIDGSEERSAS